METKDPCEKSLAREAKKVTSILLKKADRIDLLNLGRGKYFRVLADVHIDGLI